MDYYGLWLSGPKTRGGPIVEIIIDTRGGGGGGGEHT